MVERENQERFDVRAVWSNLSRMGRSVPLDADSLDTPCCKDESMLLILQTLGARGPGSYRRFDVIEQMARAGHARRCCEPTLVDQGSMSDPNRFFIGDAEHHQRGTQDTRFEACHGVFDVGDDSVGSGRRTGAESLDEPRVQRVDLASCHQALPRSVSVRD